MKKIIVVILMIIGVQAKSQEWAAIGTKWYYNYNVATGWFGVPGTDYSIFESVGDTLIDGISCRKIQKSKIYTYFQRPNVEYTYYSNDSVFFYDFQFDQFQLLYDFDATPGESWIYQLTGDSYVGDIDTIKTVVDSTALIMINSITLKLLYVHYEPLGFESDWMFDDYPSTKNSQIIQFIGDVQNMVSTYFLDELISDFICPSGLRCYDDSFIGHYETGIVDSCNYVNVLSVNENISESFSIFPNPVSDKLFVNISAQTYHIYSLDGRLMSTGNFEEEDFVNVTHLISGMYLLRIVTTDNQIYQTTFVKE